MPNPVPTLPTFIDGQDFDTEARLKVLNYALVRIRDKFGALVANDLSGGVLHPLGPIDARSNLVSNVSETMRVINYEQDGRSLDTILRNATEPVVVYIPGNVTAHVTTPAPLRDDCQVVGSGWGSNVRVSVTTGIRSIFEVTGGTNWALRNLRVDGGRNRASGTYTHHGIFISGVDDANGMIDGVIFGTPRLEGELTNGIPRWGIFISSSSEVKVMGCVVRQCSSGGVTIKDSSHIVFGDTKIQRNSGDGLLSDGSSYCTVFGGKIQWNEGTNVRLIEGSCVLVYGNDIESPSCDGFSAASVGSKSNIYLLDMTDPMIVSNHILDKTNGTNVSSTFGSKSALYQVETSSTGGTVRRLVFVGNYMNETSQSPTHGRINKLLANGLAQNFVRAENHIFGEHNWVSLKRGHGGWKPTGNPVIIDYNNVQWNYFTGENGAPRPDDDALGSNYQPEFCLVGGGGFRSGGRDGRNIGRQLNQWDYGFYALQSGRSWFTLSGNPSHYFRIGMHALITILGNEGNVLTPAVVGSGLSHIEDELQGVQATFNIFERSAGLVPEHPSGMLYAFGDNGQPQNGIEPKATWLPYWGTTEGIGHQWGGVQVAIGQNRIRMNENVLCAYITSTSPYGLDTGVVDADLKRGSKFVTIWSGVTNSHRDQRPTWVDLVT